MLAVAGVLMIGVRESARTNTVMVFFKLAVLLLFLVLGVTAFKADNFSPFFVEGEGIGGTVTAATLIFFAYIGFDAVSTSSEEVKEPKRDLPRAIIGSLLIATTLYILVAIVATGALPFDELKGEDAPLAKALSDGAGMDWAANIISFGALVAITSVVLTLLYGQSRILFAMSRDGLMPKRISKVNPTYADAGAHHRRLRRAVRAAGRVRAAQGDRRAGQHRHAVRVRRRQPRGDHPAPHAARPAARLQGPARPVFPIIGTLLCVYLMADLPGTTWVRFFIWMAIGLASTSSTAAPTRGCAGARSSPRRRSFPGLLAGQPRPDSRRRVDDQRVAPARAAGPAPRGRGWSRASRSRSRGARRAPRRPTVEPRGSVWPIRYVATRAARVSVTVL